MLSPKNIRKALKDRAGGTIYSRGVDYFRRGLVKKWSFEEHAEDETYIVMGTVKGSEMYEVMLEYDTSIELFLDIECTCPYGSVCKHAVAVGLTLVDSLEKESDANAEATEPHVGDVVPASQNDVNESALRKALGDLGLSEEALPEKLIAQLLQYRKQPGIHGATRKSKSLVIDKPVQKPFNPQDYFIVLDYHYAPSFHAKKYPYQQTSESTVLARNDITEAQRETLAHMQKGTLTRMGALLPNEPIRLFSLLLESGFPIYKGYYAYNHTSAITLNIRPEPLKAEIIYLPVPMYGDETKIRHDFFLRMPESYWRDTRNRYDIPLGYAGATVLRDLGNTIEFHQLTPFLVGILSRMATMFDYGGKERKIAYREARLTGEEMAQFDQLLDEASKFFILTSPPPLLQSRAVTSVPQPVFEVDFDHAAQTLSVAPMLDYGRYRQDISESVFVARRRNGDVVTRRPPFEHPGSHIVTVADGVIYHTCVDEKKEKAYYSELAERASDLGFTKTLKCQKRGSRQIGEFLHAFWPKLLEYAQKQGYPIIFTKDAVALEQMAFRADITTDINADTDWLYFDAACYCGDERITLEKLLAYVASGEPFWRKDDGTLVEISNRKDLERLARLLKGFHAREEGGFEGRLYHAAEVEYVLTSSTHYNAVRAKSFKQFLSRLEKGKPLKNVRLSRTLMKILRPYQKSGIDWLYFLRTHHFAGILADDMGLGKTLQTLAVVHRERIAGKPSLVVCPKTLLYNWKQEAEKFFPELKVLVYEGTPLERQAMRKKIKQYDMVVTSYSTLKQDVENLCASPMRFNYAVLDEAQFIKNHATKNAQAVKKLHSDFRLALTGTPLENNVSELWSIYDFLMPDFLGAYEYFAEYFHRPIMDARDKEALQHLRRKVGCFMLRRTKSEVLKELPPKIETESQCRLSEAQNLLYQQILAKVRGDVFAAVREKGFKSAQIHILAGLTKLRQACNHPALLTKDKDFRAYESTKLDMCLELVNEVVKSGRKVLIFSQFTQMLDIISATLKDHHIEHVYLSGKTKDRQSVVTMFNTNPAIPVFLISMKAGGTGLNLTAADTVIIFDPWWNPSVENQAIDRTHRIGQVKTVNVYRLLTAGTIEEKIQALKQKKQLLFDALVNESGDMFQKMTWDDVRELFADERP